MPTEWVRLCSGATSRGGSRCSSVRICCLRCLTLALVCCAVWAAAAGAARSHGSAGAAGSGAGGLPLVGVNYSHFGVLGCGVDGDGIVANGMGNRTLIRRQLAAMRAAGIQSLRTFIWSQHDATGQAWGVVSSAGGRLGPTEERNLIDFVTDIRLAGFKRLSVAFSPRRRTTRSAIQTTPTIRRCSTRTGSSFARCAGS